MAEAKLAETWDHTAAICATVINMHRDPKRSKPVEADKLNPYRKPKKSNAPVVRLNKADSMSLLKRVFIEHKPVNEAALVQGKIE